MTDEFNCVFEDITHEGIRLDKYLSDHLDLFTRSQMKQRVESLFVNDEASKFSRKLMVGDKIRLTCSIPPELDILAEDIPLDILYEDENVIVVNKPRGMVVHPAVGNWTGTLVNALLYHYKNLKGNFEDEHVRPGIVHRLDKDTSGVLITAKNARAHGILARQFKEAITKKTYLAVVKGSPPKTRDIIDVALRRDPNNRKKFKETMTGGKEAQTEYTLLKTFDRFSFMKMNPVTGRTHQIRVHLKSIKCPILGDSIYSRKDHLFPDMNLMLHAFRLRIKLPGIMEPMVFNAPIPDHFLSFMAEFGYSPLNDPRLED